MKIKTNAHYYPQRNEWEFTLEDDCYEFFIFSSKEEKIEIKIVKKHTKYWEELKEQKELKKRVKESALFNEIMEKIKNWEQKMKDMLMINQVEIIGKEEENGNEYYFFSFEIQSKLAALGKFTLDEKEEKILEHFADYSNHPEQNPRFVFILPLIKSIVENQVVFQYDEGFPMVRATVTNGMEKNVTLEQLQRSYGRIGIKHFTTHRSFNEDIVKKINEAPSVRIKKLVI